MNCGYLPLREKVDEGKQALAQGVAVFSTIVYSSVRSSGDCELDKLAHWPDKQTSGCYGGDRAGGSPELGC